MAEQIRSTLRLLPTRHVQMTAEEEAAAIEAVAALLGALLDRPEAPLTTPGPVRSHPSSRAGSTDRRGGGDDEQGHADRRNAEG